MAQINTSSQAIKKPDVFDVLMGGDMSWDPSQTPLFSTLKKGPDSPDASLFQFPYDIPDTPTLTGSAEGGDYSQAATTTFGGRALLYGRMHHKKTFFGVGEVAQGNQVYGTNGADEFTYQMRRALRFLLKSMEYISVSLQESQAGNGSDTFTTRGLELWITPTGSIADQTDTATVVPANFRPAAAQVATVAISSGDYTMDEQTYFADVFNSVYDTLKDRIDYTIHCTTAFKSKVSKLANFVVNTTSGYQQVRKFNQTMDSGKILATIEEWVGDSGRAKFELHPWLRTTTTQKAEAIGLDDRFAMWRVRQQPKALKLPPAGGGERGEALVTMGLQVLPKYLSKWKRND